MKQWYKVEVAGRIALWWSEGDRVAGDEISDCAITDGLWRARSIEELEGLGYTVTPVVVLTVGDWNEWRDYGEEEGWWERYSDE